MKAEIIFEVYVNCDIDIMTSELSAVDNLIDDKLMDANLSFDKEKCQEISLSSFKGAIDNIEKLRTYFVYQNTNEKIFHELNSIHNAVINTKRQSTHQMTIKDILIQHLIERN